MYVFQNDSAEAVGPVLKPVSSEIQQTSVVLSCGHLCTTCMQGKRPVTLLDHGYSAVDDVQISLCLSQPHTHTHTHFLWQNKILSSIFVCNECTFIDYIYPVSVEKLLKCSKLEPGVLTPVCLWKSFSNFFPAHMMK